MKQSLFLAVILLIVAITYVHAQDSGTLAWKKFSSDKLGFEMLYPANMGCTVFEGESGVRLEKDAPRSGDTQGVEAIINIDTSTCKGLSIEQCIEKKSPGTNNLIAKTQALGEGEWLELHYNAHTQGKPIPPDSIKTSKAWGDNKPKIDAAAGTTMLQKVFKQKLPFKVGGEDAIRVYGTYPASKENLYDDSVYIKHGEMVYEFFSWGYFRDNNKEITDTVLEKMFKSLKFLK